MTDLVNWQPIPPRAPPATTTGTIGWLRVNLFSTWYNTLLTIVLVWFLAELVPPLLNWALFEATLFSAIGADDPAAVCREGDGACWAFIAEWWRFILFGRFPYDEHWRPAVAVAVLIGLWVVSCDRRFWNRRLLYLWGAGLPLAFVLMAGGLFGLTEVPAVNWGGLPLTIGLSTFGIGLAFPIGVLLALGRRSNLPVIRVMCVTYIELVRGVPLITVLFMAGLMLPLFLPNWLTIDGLLRAQIGIILFAAAYLAEVVRGGLQSLPRGQYEAADSLGLTYWQKTGLIILPQALRVSIPPLVNTFIGLFKDTSLVFVVSLLDLVGAAKQALTNPAWRGFYQESYFFIAVLFFLFCFSMSKYSQWLEQHLNSGTRR